ncbi:hypothetical protein EWH21_09540 [Pseudomonas sp. REST10]|uniref:hypothetical protein n=1 Tax=Pseudomonas sp. REST10 TaxID=2512235 RepID=UPI00240E20CD|nr:hypothetical protein [Pseudomonas sp. REST10]WFC61959.1 hypothetical protein EWH21_09540 [Pseudomonas sp. REST10]
MRAIAFIGIALLAVAVSGCQSWSVISAKKLEPGTSKTAWTVAVPITKASTQKNTGELSQWEQLFGTSSAATSYQNYCFKTAGTKGLGSFGAAIAVAMGGVAWDLAVDAANSKIEKIQEQSVQSWSATWTPTPSDLKTTECLALVRYTDAKTPDPQMAVLLMIQPAATGKSGVEAVQFAPLMVRSKSSVALTKDEGDGSGKIGLSIAPAISSFHDGELKDATPDAISIGDVTVTSLGKNADGYLKKVGTATHNGDLSTLAYTKPSVYSTSGALHLKFAVVETGTLAGKDTKAKAELKAVTDALGPIAKDALKKRILGDDAK